MQHWNLLPTLPENFWLLYRLGANSDVTLEKRSIFCFTSKDLIGFVNYITTRFLFYNKPSKRPRIALKINQSDTSWDKLPSNNCVKSHLTQTLIGCDLMEKNSLLWLDKSARSRVCWATSTPQDPEIRFGKTSQVKFNILKSFPQMSLSPPR